MAFSIVLTYIIIIIVIVPPYKKLVRGPIKIINPAFQALCSVDMNE